MAESAKAAILNRVVKEGYTDSYGTLLHLTAVMGSDPRALAPKSVEELATWSGHFEGLRSGLLSLAMHERCLDPQAAAAVVRRHLKEAIARLEHGDGIGTEG